jgi:hypothetical protein
MTVLTEFPEGPDRTTETLEILNIQIFTAARCDPAQARPAPQRGFPGRSGGEPPDNPIHAQMPWSGFSKPSDK